MIKIGYLRYFNEEKTILACLESYKFCDYVFCLTHEPIWGVEMDGSEEIIKSFIEENGLKDRFFMLKDPNIIFPPYHEYSINQEVPECNLVSGFCNYGLHFIKEFIKEKGLNVEEIVVFKIDGDILQLDEGKVFENSTLLEKITPLKSGFSLIMHENQIFLHESSFGTKGDYFSIPGKYLMDSFYIFTGRYEVLKVPNYNDSNHNLDNSYRFCHFIDYDKILRRKKSTYDIKNPFILRNFSKNPEIIDVFESKVRPFLQLSDSPYKNFRFVQ